MRICHPECENTKLCVTISKFQTFWPSWCIMWWCAQKNCCQPQWLSKIFNIHKILSKILFRNRVFEMMFNNAKLKKPLIFFIYWHEDECPRWFLYQRPLVCTNHSKIQRAWQCFWSIITKAAKKECSFQLFEYKISNLDAAWVPMNKNDDSCNKLKYKTFNEKQNPDRSTKTREDVIVVITNFLIQSATKMVVLLF